MSDKIREMLFPLMLVLVVMSVWVFGWAQESLREKFAPIQQTAVRWVQLNH